MTELVWLLITLRREGENPRLLGMFFKVVVHAVLLLGSETWMMTLHMGQGIGGFQHRVAIWITARQPLRFLDVSW